MNGDWRLPALLAVVLPVLVHGAIPWLGEGTALSLLGVAVAPFAWGATLLFGVIAALRLHGRGPAGRVGEPASDARDPYCGAQADAVPGRGPVPGSADGLPVERPCEWSPAVLARIEWKRFEDLCCAFYREKGIRAQTSPLGPDGGVDIHLYQDAADPDRTTAIVQCRAQTTPIDARPVHALRELMAREGVEKAFFMAPGGFTDEARALAAEVRVVLLDGRLFLTMLQRLPPASSARLLEFATEGEWTVPTCPNCGVKLVVRRTEGGLAWGCRLYPNCRYELPMAAGALAGA